MRTVLITNNNLNAMLSLAAFLDRFHDDVALVVVTTKLPGQTSNLAGGISMLRESGFAYTHLKVLLNITLPTVLRSMGQPVSVTDFMRRRRYPCDVLTCPSANAPAIVERIRSLKPAVLLAAGATHIFKEALIGSAPLAINLHPSLLPRHAGLSPYYWCLHEGDRRGGGTLHRIIPKLDAGPVIDQRAFDLAGVGTVLQVIQKVWDINNAMLIDLYDGKTKEAEAAPQNVAERTYHRNPTRAQVREFRRRGLGFFSTNDVADVMRRVRRI